MPRDFTLIIFLSRACLQIPISPDRHFRTINLSAIFYHTDTAQLFCLLNTYIAPPGRTTPKGASVKGVSKTVKLSCFGFNCARKLSEEFARATVTSGLVLR